MINVYKGSTVTRRKWLSTDIWNKKTYDEVETDVRLIEETRVIQDFAGEEVISIGYLLIDEEWNHEDRVKIGTNEYAIANIKAKSDFSNVFWKVFLV